jgi:transcriptional regulator with XRE-family HTH domain
MYNSGGILMPCSKKDIGERIVELRKKRKLSQQEFADALHVSREVVAKWENGSRDLKTEHTIAIADYFDVSCDEILRGIKSINVDACNKTGLQDKDIEILFDSKELRASYPIDLCSRFIKEIDLWMNISSAIFKIVNSDSYPLPKDVRNPFTDMLLVDPPVEIFIDAGIYSYSRDAFAKLIESIVKELREKKDV